jgi:hypothetical protein
LRIYPESVALRFSFPEICEILMTAANMINFPIDIYADIGI